MQRVKLTDNVSITQAGFFEIILAGMRIDSKWAVHSETSGHLSLSPALLKSYFKLLW